MYLSFGIPIGCDDVRSICASATGLLRSSLVLFKTAFLIFFANLYQIRPPAFFAVFWIALFETVLIASIAEFIVVRRSFCPELLLKLSHVFCKR